MKDKGMVVVVGPPNPANQHQPRITRAKGLWDGQDGAHLPAPPSTLRVASSIFFFVPGSFTAGRSCLLPGEAVMMRRFRILVRSKSTKRRNLGRHGRKSETKTAPILVRLWKNRLTAPGPSCSAVSNQFEVTSRVRQIPARESGSAPRQYLEAGGGKPQMGSGSGATQCHKW